MSVRSIAGIAALVGGILTVLRGTSCNAGDEVLVAAGVVGVLGAMWNDNPERNVPARIAKFLVLVLMIGFSVFFFALVLNTSRCS